MSSNSLSVVDRFAIFEQLNLHQRCIDNDSSIESVHKYQALYWPDASFTVNDIRQVTFEGMDGLKQLYDYAHSVFPLHKWSHSVGWFAIEGEGDDATVEWRWIVSWRQEGEGVVSTGTYTDKFQRRNGQWKCLQRRSDVDPNWPSALFQPWVDKADSTFKSS